MTTTAFKDLFWWRAQLDRPCFVYVVQAGDDGPVKIGRATDVVDRLATLQTGNPYPLRLLHVIPGGCELEWQLHQKLAGHRMLGEWFEAEPAYGLFPLIERLLAVMRDEYDGSGAMPPFRRRGFSWRSQRSRGAPTVRYVTPDPVPPELAGERLRQAWTRSRPRGDKQHPGVTPTTII